jgi:hypothetical protein
MALKAYGHSADYTYLDQALRARWLSLCSLEQEMAEFVPRPVDAFRPARDAELNRLISINPESDVEQLVKLVDAQLMKASAPSTQFFRMFDERHAAEYVTIILLAHALSEALINAFLAIGLAHVDSTELFPILEKADFKHKWLIGPKSFSPGYKFPTGSALHETLNNLTRQRNSLVHMKIELTVAGTKVLDGSSFERTNYIDEVRWLRRYCSLPYDLAQFLRESVRDFYFPLLSQRAPIEVAPAHADR